jgi:hypothetical protein
MATLESIKQTTIDRIATVLASNKVSYTIGNRHVSYNEYLGMLYDSLSKVNKALEDDQDLNPFELRTTHIL